MSRPKPFPIYPAKPLIHGGGARVKINGKSHYLGKYGSPESYKEYERLRAEHALGFAMPSLPSSLGMTVDELIAGCLKADPRGLDHPQVQRVARACVPLSRLFGPTQAGEYRANRLRATRDAMIDQRWMTDEEKEKCGPWCRNTINKAVQRIIIVFSWGESTEILPMGIAEHLRTVKPLEINDPRIFDHPDREPADWEAQVKPCLKFMAPVVRAMLTVQYHAGMRPDNVCRMRRCEIEQCEDGIWLYRPSKHKNKWRKKTLVIALGPIAQQTLAPWFMAAEPDGYIFPPAKRRNGAQYYLENGYAQAIRRAIKAAKVKPWCLYQLRHSAGHRAEEVGGLPAAAAVLGHHSLETTKIYTDKQRLKLAIETAKKIG
jgi:integrase